MRTVLSLLLALLLPMMAAAQADPTRPPAALLAPAPGASAPHAAAPASAPAPHVTRVQSVQVPHGGAASALVDDKLVFVGDRVGERSVTAIDGEGVLLRDARGRVSRLPLIDAQVVKLNLSNRPGLAPAPVAALAGGKQP